MKAVTITGFGAEPLLTDLPVPEPGPGELLVRLHAAALNPFDWKVADGALQGMVEHDFPLFMGSPGAGHSRAFGRRVPDGCAPWSAKHPAPRSARRRTLTRLRPPGAGRLRALVRQAPCALRPGPPGAAGVMRLRSPSPGGAARPTRPVPRSARP